MGTGQGWKESGVVDLLEVWAVAGGLRQGL